MATVFKINFTPKKISSFASSWRKEEHERNRAFYDLSAEYNYVSYSCNKEKTKENKDYLDYMERKKEDGTYNKEASSGAFNLKKDMTIEDIKNIKEKLKNSDSIIWHGFISFDEEISKNMNTSKDARDFLNATLGVLFENSHLDKDNLEFMFSLHTDTKNRHIHFSFFEKEKRFKNIKGEETFAKRGMLNEKALDEFMISSQMYFEDTRYQASKARDEALRELKEIYPRKTAFADKKISEAIFALVKKLPKGRTAYNSSNMKELRFEVDKVVNLMIAENPKLKLKTLNYMKEVSKRENIAKRIMLDNKFAYIQGKRLVKKDMEIIFNGKFENLDRKLLSKDITIMDVKSIKKLKEDLKARMGNYVIGLAKSIKLNIDPTRLDSLKDSSKKIKANQERLKLKKNIKILFKNLEKANFYRTDFTYDLRRAEREIENER